MKLRTKVVWAGCISVLFACLFSSTMAWDFSYEEQLSETIAASYWEFRESIGEVTERLMIRAERENQTFINYFFKTEDNGYNLCFRKENGEITEIYNMTNLTYEDLAGLTYQVYEEAVFWENDEYCLVSSGRERYCIFHRTLLEEYEIFQLTDITSFYDKMLRLALYMIFFGSVAVLGVSLILRWLIGRELKPVGDLTDFSREMEDGHYNKRIEVKSKNELGILSESFNGMAEAIETRDRELLESEKRKTLFMGNLTHELKTPLTAISGYAQALMRAGLSDRQREEACAYIYRECHRLDNLSKKMMILLELDKEQTIDMVTISAEALLEEVRESCQVILETKQITMETVTHGEHFTADRELMCDVLINLIDNAVKASEPGQSIIVSAEENRISVRDFGQGIPLEEQKKILQPFYRVDKSRSRKNGGSGLGLALVKQVLDKHHAELLLTSEPGKGSCFTIQFREEVSLMENREEID